MKVVASDNTLVTSSTYDVKVSLTRSGLPRILPSYFRVLIRANSTWAIKLVLTLLGLYRVIPYRGKVKLSTITNPFKGFIPRDMVRFIPIFLKLLSLKPFRFSFRPFVLSAQGSVSSPVLVQKKKEGKWVKDFAKGNSSSGLLKALYNLDRLGL
jgi:hypothetical protein